MEPSAGNSPDSGTHLGHLQAGSSESAEAESTEGRARQPAGIQGAKSGSKSAKTRSAAEAAKYHKVKKGETLSSIAEIESHSVAALKRDNPKLTANVRAGEVLLIRK